jgi:hypothetical protein
MATSRRAHRVIRRHPGFLVPVLEAIQRVRTMKILPPRRISNDERKALEHSIATDPDVERALAQLLLRRPHLKKKGSPAVGVSDRPVG